MLLKRAIYYSILIIAISLVYLFTNVFDYSLAIAIGAIFGELVSIFNYYVFSYLLANREIKLVYLAVAGTTCAMIASVLIFYFLTFADFLTCCGVFALTVAYEAIIQMYHPTPKVKNI